MGRLQDWYKRCCLAFLRSLPLPKEEGGEGFVICYFNVVIKVWLTWSKHNYLTRCLWRSYPSRAWLLLLKLSVDNDDVERSGDTRCDVSFQHMSCSRLGTHNKLATSSIEHRTLKVKRRHDVRGFAVHSYFLEPIISWKLLVVDYAHRFVCLTSPDVCDQSPQVFTLIIFPVARFSFFPQIYVELTLVFSDVIINFHRNKYFWIVFRNGSLHSSDLAQFEGVGSWKVFRSRRSSFCCVSLLPSRKRSRKV